MRIHIHKWKFLVPQKSKVKKESSHYYGIYSGSSTETETKQVTHLRRICSKCGYVKTQTIDGEVVGNIYKDVKL